MTEKGGCFRDDCVLYESGVVSEIAFWAPKLDSAQPTLFELPNDGRGSLTSVPTRKPACLLRKDDWITSSTNLQHGSRLSFWMPKFRSPQPTHPELATEDKGQTFRIRLLTTRKTSVIYWERMTESCRVPEQVRGYLSGCPNSDRHNPLHQNWLQRTEDRRSDFWQQERTVNRVDRERIALCSPSIIQMDEDWFSFWMPKLSSSQPTSSELATEGTGRHDAARFPVSCSRSDRFPRGWMKGCHVSYLPKKNNAILVFARISNEAVRNWNRLCSQTDLKYLTISLAIGQTVIQWLIWFLEKDEYQT